MTVGIHIEDPSNSSKATVDSTTGEKKGLVVATRPLKTQKNRTTFFLNETYGADMNQSGAYGGTPIGIHNGTDNTYWTGAAVKGTWVFNSTDQTHAGSKSVDGTSAGKNGEASFSKGSTQDLTGYLGLSGWIYITSYDQGTHIELQAKLSAVDVGNKVNIDEYFDTTTFNSWQYFSLPLTYMSLAGESIDAFHLKIKDADCKIYLDDFQIEETGANIEYTVEPKLGTWFHVERIRQAFVDNVSADNADSTMYQLSYNKILGETLTNGYLYQQFEDGTSIQTVTVKSIADLLQYPFSFIDNAVSDGTNTMITISYELKNPLILKSEDKDKLVVTIREDLSGLLLFRQSVNGWEEER